MTHHTYNPDVHNFHLAKPEVVHICKVMVSFLVFCCLPRVCQEKQPMANRAEQSCPAVVNLTVNNPAGKDWHGGVIS